MMDRDAESASRPPLAGIRVVELAQVAAGPYLGSLLGDMGADVIKVEPLEGDSLRTMDDGFARGSSTYFVGLNRSKRALCVNLKDQVGSSIFQRLLETADVLIVGMRPSAVASLGLTYEDLARLYPRLIYVSITAFGDTGPRAEEPGMDILAQAMSGIIGLTGEPDGPPVKVGPAITDMATSYIGGFAVASAILARLRDGQGQKVSLNLLQSAIGLLPNYAASYLRSGTKIRPMGGAHSQFVPYKIFPTADSYVVIACISDRFWPRICEAMNRPDLAADPDYVSNPGRVRHRADIERIISEELASDTTAHWLSRLRARDVPCSPVYRIEEVFEDPQNKHNHAAVELTHPTFGPYRVVRTPIEMSRSSPEPRGHAPLLGEHNDEILADLGYSSEESASFKRNRVIRTSVSGGMD